MSDRNTADRSEIDRDTIDRESRLSSYRTEWGRSPLALVDSCELLVLTSLAYDCQRGGRLPLEFDREYVGEYASKLIPHVETAAVVGAVKNLFDSNRLAFDAEGFLWLRTPVEAASIASALRSRSRAWTPNDDASADGEE